MTEPTETTVEVVEQDAPITITKKELEKMVTNAIINIEKKDYRATLNLNTNQQQVPDAMTAFIDVSESDKNEYAFNRALDVKGTLTPFQLWKNRLTRVAVALSSLKDWRYVEREDLDNPGEVLEVPVDLAQLAAEEERWLSLSLFGQQSEKEIRLMRAGFGMNEETTFDKGARWFGLVKKKKTELYGRPPTGKEV